MSWIKELAEKYLDKNRREEDYIETSEAIDLLVGFHNYMLGREQEQPDETPWIEISEDNRYDVFKHTLMFRCVKDGKIIEEWFSTPHQVLRGGVHVPTHYKILK